MPYVSGTILLCEYVWTTINAIKYTNETHLDLTAYLDHGKTTEVHTIFDGEISIKVIQIHNSFLPS